MANPTRLSWAHDQRNTDGTEFTFTQFAGFELEINGGSAVSIPAEWNTAGVYSLPLADLAAVQKSGGYTLRMRVVNRAGNASDFSAPVTFSMDFRVPTAPSGLSVG